MAESAQTKDPEVYIIGDTKQEEKVNVKPEVPKESVTPPIGFKLNFSKFVPVSTPVQNQSKKTPQTDLMSLFGSHSDEEEEKEKQFQYPQSVQNGYFTMIVPAKTEQADSSKGGASYDRN